VLIVPVLMKKGRAEERLGVNCARTQGKRGSTGTISPCSGKRNTGIKELDKFHVQRKRRDTGTKERE
jgi:hypothetical protein